MPLPLTAALTRVGVGLRAPHMQEVLATRPDVGWFEVHAENYFDNAPGTQALEAVRRDYQLSLHGVGLSLGSATCPEPRHLQQLKLLIRRLDPVLVSEHLSWSIWEGGYLNELLPLPYTEESLAIVCRNVEHTQARLGRRILLENPSAYLRFRHSTIAEADFLNEVASRTGCALLCDLNNVYVSSCNLGFDALEYLEKLPWPAVAQIHLAGHQKITRRTHELLIDDHGGPVAPSVWAPYAHALSHFGAVPTLIEWDQALPAFERLAQEAQRAEAMRRPNSALRENPGARVA